MESIEKVFNVVKMFPLLAGRGIPQVAGLPHHPDETGCLAMTIYVSLRGVPPSAGRRSNLIYRLPRANPAVCGMTLAMTKKESLRVFFVNVSLRSRIFAGETIPQTAGQFAVWDLTIQCLKWYKILS